MAAATKVKVLKTSTERLLAVADIVEADDGRWSQGSWAKLAEDHATDHPEDNETDEPGVALVNANHTCGSYGCIAGWAVAMAPKGSCVANDWIYAGAMALEVDYNHAEELFDSYLGRHSPSGERSARVAKGLRYLATFEPGHRSFDEVWDNFYVILEGLEPELVGAP